MRRIVLRFGLIAGGVLAAGMLVTTAFMDRIGFDRAAAVGYTIMVVAFLCAFFGIRAYRDEVAGGVIGFGRACAVGLLVTAVASACYVATWQVVYYRIAPDFAERYAEHVLAKERAAGASAAALDARAREMARFQEMYRNPLINVAITFLEPLPVGVVMTLVSAAALRRRRRPDGAPVLEEAPAAG